ncbi:SpoIIE family protein phosphatase [Streptomyces sp. NPDC007861]|uniref:SpoIIE family protein phosphatase n=1 Tax=Streptomyces sp. NPDC007861 TaxID=3154893 RepID=UPI0033EB06C6
MDVHESTSGVPAPPVSAVGYAGVLSELLPIALWRADAEGRIVEWSLAAQDLLGYLPEQVVGRCATPLLVPEANWELADDLERRVQAGEAVMGTLPARHRDGHLVPMEMWICPTADPHGETGILVIAVETSAVLRMRDSLAALEGLFRQSPIGLAILGRDLRYARVNDALARMNGVSAAQHLGRRPTELVPGVNAVALERVMQKVLDDGRAVVDVRGTGRTPADPDRDRVWSCSYAPLLDGGGGSLGLIASLIDITDGQQAQLQAERARQRFSLLAEAGTRIGTTLDLRQTAEEVVEVLVPRLADMADVLMLEDMLGPDGAAVSAHGVVRRMAARFPDPSAPTAGLAVGMTAQIPVGSVYEHVVVEGRPMNLTLADVPALITAPGAERLRTYLSTEVGSARLVPLVARGRALGAVVVSRIRGREPFDEQDCVLIDELVGRAALNIDNARMYTGQREAALALQRSLTLKPLPDVAGLELMGRYLPASAHEVGGDWFDVIPLPGGRAGLVIGDVMGHGIRAAATMGQLRTAVRTLAGQDLPPDRMLSALDAAVADLGENEMATCVYAVHDPAAGRCLIARAGHPPPALVSADGTVTFVDGPAGTPLGAGGRHFRVEQTPLLPESLLVLYTDGLIETRERDIDQGMGLLARALRHPGRSLEEVCDRVIGRLLPSSAEDDVAVLIARALPRRRPAGRGSGRRPPHSPTRNARPL